MFSKAKIVTPTVAADVRKAFRARGLSVGLCHGCFDILHSGHIHYLQQASRRVDVLVVSITTARFVNKGANRPVFNDDARADVVAAMGMVDYVVVNDHETAVPLISSLSPDYFFKGAEYQRSQDPRIEDEKRALVAVGGAILYTDDEVVDSSTRAAQVVGAGQAM
jgi:rfaE bifunctional protein nucleotidyltransferase chain/domain